VRFGIDLAPAGECGDPRSLAELAALAERSGWDGVFLEDYFVHPSGVDSYDPWAALAVIALATSRIRLGTMVTPLPARAPWQVASQAVTVDHLSAGRLILGEGSGYPESVDVKGLGGPPELRVRAQMLDEGLQLVDALWSGRRVDHRGSHYRLDGVTLMPRPVQRPRIPIWVGGQLTRHGPRERALRYDGACLYRAKPPDWEDLAPGQVAELRRDSRDGFEIAVGGRERREDETAERDYIGAIAAAGATWWHEYLPPATPLEEVRRHIHGGPLR
jgi:alkanesulfonate monooxygenase SsuD/methylene tetrahydromethanopterin reductase-like flavin-dependent oxidoreductase (luciferase family)